MMRAVVDGRSTTEERTTLSRTKGPQCWMDKLLEARPAARFGVPSTRWIARAFLALTVLAACAPFQPMQPGRQAPEPSEPSRARKTLTTAVGLPITSIAAVNLAGSGQGMVTFVELHSNGLVTSDANGRPIPSARNPFAGSNRGHYENPELADLQARYRTATGEAEQGALIRRIADLFAQEAPLLVLYYNPVFATLRTGVSALDDFGGGHVGGGYFGSYPRTSHLWNKD